MKFKVFLLLLGFYNFCSAQTLVLPGDYPDPSVVRIGNSYWATATTSNWAPVYPLMESEDLIHWKNRGHVFQSLPSWADFYFWAPEISYDNGKVYVYYAAHKKGGNLCLGIASADKPEGPYMDHGALMCEEAGSIDAFPMRDENGKLFLIWKEDGNSVGKPTPIWAMPLNEERTALTGEKVELFRNDAAWEGNLVEGVSIIQHGRYYYAFYAGAGCCGPGCTYATGVARAEKLLGPWEKYPGNPVMGNNDEWKCPGHGTPIEKDGRYFFMLHAYDREDGVFAGRQGVLQEFTFTDDGWIKFKDEQIADAAIPENVRQDFSSNVLGPAWQWSVFTSVNYRIEKGRLSIDARPDAAGAFLGHKTLTGDYQTEITYLPGTSTAAGGFGLVGDEQNFIIVRIDKNKLSLVRMEKGKETVLLEQSLKGTDPIRLRVDVQQGKNISFRYKVEEGQFVALNPRPLNGELLPPWDRAIRIGVMAKGSISQKAYYDDFVLINK